jgi:Raf kinase inhibitor-like YbhB/YbcL family protein
MAVLLIGCTSAAPTTSAPTSPPAAVATVAPSPVTAASAVAKPASPAASPAVAASPAASPAAVVSPVPSPAAAGASPSPGPVVAAPLLFTGLSATSGFELTSSAFTAGGTLPSQYSCDGPNGGGSPPLAWSGAPSTTRALALIEQDPDVPPPNAVTHWLTYNIPSTVSQLEAGQPPVETLPNGAMQGLNSRRTLGYIASCPPAGAAPHHYTLQLFALDATLPLQPGATIVDVQRAMTGHTVAQTELVVLFGH